MGTIHSRSTLENANDIRNERALVMITRERRTQAVTNKLDDVSFHPSTYNYWILFQLFCGLNFSKFR